MTTTMQRQAPRARIQARPAAGARWMVFGFCPLTGPWREVVHAETAAGALASYCAAHDMDPLACHVRPV